MRDGMTVLIYLVVYAAFGTACSLIAKSRGRSPVGWFFVGFFASCIGLILVLVLPDLKIEQEKHRRLADENRRLREKLKKDRIVADERHAETQRRIGAHDVALGVDTTGAPIAALPGSAAQTDIPPPPPASSDDIVRLKGVSWFWADGVNRQGPIAFATLLSLWNEGRVAPDTLVWCKGMPKWTAVMEVPALQDALDG